MSEVDIGILDIGVRRNDGVFRPLLCTLFRLNWASRRFGDIRISIRGTVWLWVLSPGVRKPGE